MKIAPQNLVIVSLGANLGNPSKVIPEAVARLAAFADGPLLRSSLWETDPIDCPPGSPVFLNAAVGFRPQVRETPESLLAKLKKMEIRAGRKAKTVTNEPRPLDLDLIVFQTELRNTPELTVPHPRAHLRAFVLAPVSEIASTLVIPGQTVTVAALLKALPAAEKKKVRKVGPIES